MCFATEYLTCARVCNCWLPGRGKKKWMSSLAGSQCICLLSFTPLQLRWKLAIFKSDVCVCSHGECSFLGEKEKKKKILKAPAFRKQIFLPPLMQYIPGLLSLHLGKVEVVKQNPVTITGQFKLADQGRQTLSCNTCSVRIALLADSGALPNSVSLPQPWPV